MNSPSNKNILLVPSGSMHPNGPGYSTEIRLNEAIRLFCQYPFDYIFCSGGITSNYENIPASELMKIYLIKHNIPEKQIITGCHNSRDSYENIQELLAWLKNNMGINLSSINLTIVSNLDHLIRFEIICRQASFKRLDLHIVEMPLTIPDKITEMVKFLITMYDPIGKKFINRYARKKRTF
ncbi:MAG: hypothetical protein UR93_C0002G0013 [Berkelbacteria bacterium GW2011_GWA2_35_9]|uniref:DUF218 domain-containing protein n=1 Tax=Berkelbacteria bacterium GW2011_GWA2_35_9 TaxID=1618333 RepID=A0A0G0DJY7_9BACT|nr:MAG: hypothetical protein UR93_C0002G0013 [Berkelbacteria bacterium GW2011_GWA2_35_9]